ncbi:MAG: gliding motility-associated C-terminal domain-containing protein [Bacteroidetes bacterium]|nr:gliding motility-associated C-terminal domain-containing protein [Bacteroidota bacterium]
MGKENLRTLRKYFLCSGLLLFFCIKAYATHVFGIDMYYTHVSGNTYKIYIIIYGDCAGNAFPSLQNASPQVKVYEDPSTNVVASLSLVEEPPIAGVEVTPVCPADVNNTTCTNVNNPIPGIKKFVYSLNYTVPYASANWRFHFTGSTVTSSAGRSTTITNIVNPGSTIIALDAKLNNLNADNNSSVFGTIPTPFYCLNVPANYAPGSVDPDNDSLYFVQIPGKDAAGFPAVPPNVTYIAPYTATAPLAANPFIFVPTTGQMSFTPNLVQRSLAVMEVQEYRNNIMVGTSQREMTVVVLNTCNNFPPGGIISNPSAGTLLDSTTLRVCQDVGPFTFNINPHDPNNDTFDVAPIGLPAGATLTITNNHTPSPTCVFSWNTTNVAPATYIFYLNYTDNECPLSAYQQMAYKVIIAPSPGNAVVLLSPATCAKKAVFTVNPGAGVTNWTETVLQGVTIVHTNTNLNTILTDSLAAGTYTIRVTNDVGCSKDTVLTIAPPVMPSIAASYTPPTCPGATDGTITVTGTGGAPPYTYAIGLGPYTVTNVFTGLGAGSYNLYLQDTNKCIKDTVIALPDGLPILLDISVKRPTCSGHADGIVTIVGYNNPVTPYTYAMNLGPFGPSGTFTGLAAGTYTFHVHNGTGCDKDTVITLTDSLFVTAAINTNNLLCNGDLSGIITATGAGGINPYTYALNANPFTYNNTFNSLAAGTYTVHVLDVNACAYDAVVTLTQPSPLTVAATVSDPLCNGFATGAITVNGAGGTAPYTYANGAGPYTLGNTFNGLAAGTYTIHVHDANNCQKDTALTITQPGPITLSPVVTNVLCYGNITGSITINATGGTPGYTYANGANAYSPINTFTPLAAGSYTIHTKDANGCIKDTILNITQPTPLNIQAAVTLPQCYGSTGSITITASGGTPAYTYANGAGPYGPGNVFTSLPAGTYTIHTKDANSCVKDTVIGIAQPTAIHAAPTATNVLCYGGTATIAIVANGGSPAYTYANGAGPYGPDSLFSGLTAGTYTIHVKDSKGCIKDTFATIQQPQPLDCDVAINEPSCYGFNDGSLSITANGGTPAYLFGINAQPMSGNTSYAGLPAGTDTVHIKDANGCVYDTVIAVMQPAQIIIDSIVSNPDKCFGDNNGSLIVYVSGGTPAYQYVFDNGGYQLSPIGNDLVAGVHSIHITDSRNCPADTTAVVTQPNPLYVNISAISEPTCEGYTDGDVSLFGSGGTVPYMYTINTGPFTLNPDFTGLPEGSYSFTIEDSNGCRHDTTVTLVGLPHITITDAIATPARCYGSNDGIITINAVGGTPPFYYQVDNGPVPASDTNVFMGIAVGRHIVTVTDSNNCRKSGEVFITQPDSLHILFSVVPNECSGTEDKGIISAEVTGGTSPYNYTWSNDTGAIGMNVISNLANGAYRLIVHDSNNCILSADTAMFTEECCIPYIPNAFTPNGDGKNDVFRAVFKGNMNLILFSVYNRFGEQVFTTDKPGKGWNGMYKGRTADMGTYFFYIRFICGADGKEQFVKGDVTLIR